MCTLDSDSDYILRITSIQDDIKTDEEVIIQNKQACDGKIQGMKDFKKFKFCPRIPIEKQCNYNSLTPNRPLIQLLSAWSKLNMEGICSLNIQL